MAFKGSPSSQHQHCTDEAQKAETVLLQLDIALWCKNQIEHSIWDESLLLSNCACSLEYSSLSTLAGLSYHICGKLEVAFKGSPSSQHQHCTDEAQKAETVLSAVIYIYIYIYIYFFFIEEVFKGCPLVDSTPQFLPQKVVASLTCS